MPKFCSMCNTNIDKCTCANQQDRTSPRMVDMAASFAKSALNHAKNLFENVSDPIQKQRLQICQECPFFDAEKIKCKKCGCFLMVKTSWASESCPDGKWSSQERRKVKKRLRMR